MPSRTAFITGIAGFAGSHLAEELLEHGYVIAGSLLPGEPLDNIRPIKRHLKLFNLDITDERRCREVLTSTKPEYLFHLAALASVGQSFQMQRQTYRVNFEGTLNLLQACLNLKRLKKFLFVSSADCYGIIKPAGKLLTESDPLNPVSPYGIAKAASEDLCRFYHRHFEMPVVIARAFNHSGPRQSDSFVIPDFAKQVAAIEAGRQRPAMKVGDLSVRRDLSDVRDIVNGYRLLAQRGLSGETYQLCSGKAVAIQTVLNSLLKMSSYDIKVTVDKKRVRKVDIPVLRGSYRKANSQTGFSPSRSLRETLSDTLDYYRNQFARG